MAMGMGVSLEKMRICNEKPVLFYSAAPDDASMHLPRGAGAVPMRQGRGTQRNLSLTIPSDSEFVGLALRTILVNLPPA